MYQLRSAVQLCTLRATGRFVADYGRVPLEVLSYLTQQLSLDPVLSPSNPGRPATTTAQFGRIRQHLGWQEFDGAAGQAGSGSCLGFYPERLSALPRWNRAAREEIL
jgi:hypothetical protein